MKIFFKNTLFILMTLIFLIIAREIMVLLHEWSHGALAWIFGAKKNPFDIYYGGWLLLDVDEAVDYLSLYEAGKIWIVAAIAFLPVMVNGLIYLLCLWVISFPFVQLNKILYTFVFWFTVVNLGEFYSYIPIRTFGSHGDVGNLIRVLNISPWIIFLPGIILITIATWHLFKSLLPQFYLKNNFTNWQRSFYLILVLLTYFYWFGHSGANSYGIISKIFSWISITLIPILFIICYPSKNRTENRL